MWAVFKKECVTVPLNHYTMRVEKEERTCFNFLCKSRLVPVYYESGCTRGTCFSIVTIVTLSYFEWSVRVRVMINEGDWISGFEVWQMSPLLAAQGLEQGSVAITITHPQIHPVSQIQYFKVLLHLWVLLLSKIVFYTKFLNLSGFLPVQCQLNQRQTQTNIIKT